MAWQKQGQGRGKKGVVVLGDFTGRRSGKKVAHRPTDDEDFITYSTREQNGHAVCACACACVGRDNCAPKLNPPPGRIQSYIDSRYLVKRTNTGERELCVIKVRLIDDVMKNTAFPGPAVNSNNLTHIIGFI